MPKHITVTVHIVETQEREEDSYGKVKRDRETSELAHLTIRADTLEDAHRKVRAVMAGALPLPEQMSAEVAKLIRSSTYGKDTQTVTPGLVP